MKQEFECNPSEESIGEVYKGLSAFNRNYFPEPGEIEFACFLKDASGNIQGGVVGKIVISTARIKYLWVSEHLRNRGYGKELMATIEREAKSRQLISITLETYSFQAPLFYERLGFKKVGEFLNSPVMGINEIFYQKMLNDH
jgi:ribosomal protein S18 acetylase RimI-like enzyme